MTSPFAKPLPPVRIIPGNVLPPKFPIPKPSVQPVWDIEKLRDEYKQLRAKYKGLKSEVDRLQSLSERQETDIAESEQQYLDRCRSFTLRSSSKSDTEPRLLQETLEKYRITSDYKHVRDRAQAKEEQMLDLRKRISAGYVESLELRVRDAYGEKTRLELALRLMEQNAQMMVDSIVMAKQIRLRTKRRRKSRAENKSMRFSLARRLKTAIAQGSLDPFESVLQSPVPSSVNTPVVLPRTSSQTSQVHRVNSSGSGLFLTEVHEDSFEDTGDESAAGLRLSDMQQPAVIHSVGNEHFVSKAKKKTKKSKSGKGKRGATTKKKAMRSIEDEQAVLSKVEVQSLAVSLMDQIDSWLPSEEDDAILPNDEIIRSVVKPGRRSSSPSRIRSRGASPPKNSPNTNESSRMTVDSVGDDGDNGIYEDEFDDDGNDQRNREAEILMSSVLEETVEVLQEAIVLHDREIGRLEIQTKEMQDKFTQSIVATGQLEARREELLAMMAELSAQMPLPELTNAKQVKRSTPASPVSLYVTPSSPR